MNTVLKLSLSLILASVLPSVSSSSSVPVEAVRPKSLIEYEV